MDSEIVVKTKAHTHHRIFGLDLLRSLAIILVLVTHTLPILDRNYAYYKLPVYTGFIGVELFFILSGFLIGTILLKIHNREGEFKFRGVKYFWIRRWFRTLPNYYLMYIVYAVLFFRVNHILVFTHIKYLSYLVFLQNTFSFHPHDFFLVAWSLSIEEWFYITFPLILFFITKFFIRNKMKSFFITILIFVVVSLIARFYSALNLNTEWDQGFRKFVPLRLDGIGFGVLIAFIKFYYPKIWKEKVKIYALSGALLFILLMILFNLYYVSIFDPIKLDTEIQANFFLKTIFFTLISFSIALLLPYFYSIKIKQNSVILIAVTFISEVSYSVYLNHILFMHLCEHFIKSNLVNFLSVWVLTFTIGYFQYRFFEKKITALRDRYGSKADAVGVN